MRGKVEAEYVAPRPIYDRRVCHKAALARDATRAQWTAYHDSHAPVRLWGLADQMNEGPLWGRCDGGRRDHSDAGDGREPAVGLGGEWKFDLEHDMVTPEAQTRTVATAHMQSTKPVPTPIQRPPGDNFSTSTNMARIAIQIMFMTPPTKSKTMRSQQQPTQ